MPPLLPNPPLRDWNAPARNLPELCGKQTHTEYISEMERYSFRSGTRIRERSNRTIEHDLSNKNLSIERAFEHERTSGSSFRVRYMSRMFESSSRKRRSSSLGKRRDAETAPQLEARAQARGAEKLKGGAGGRRVDRGRCAALVPRWCCGLYRRSRLTPSTRPKERPSDPLARRMRSRFSPVICAESGYNTRRS